MSQNVRFFNDPSALAAVAPGIDAVSSGQPAYPFLLQVHVEQAHLPGGPIRVPYAARGGVTITPPAGASWTAIGCELAAIAQGCSLTATITFADGTTATQPIATNAPTQFFGVQASSLPIARVTIQPAVDTPAPQYTVQSVQAALFAPQLRYFADAASLSAATSLGASAASVEALQANVGTSLDATLGRASAQPLTTAASITFTPSSGTAFLAFGCTLAGAGGSCNVTVSATTAAGTSTQVVALHGSGQQFTGLTADGAPITSIVLTADAINGENRFTLVGFEAAFCDAGGMVAFYDLASFERAFPGGTVTDFARANIPPNTFVPQVPTPLNAQTNNGYFQPGMIPPGIQFDAYPPQETRYFNAPSYMNPPIGKGVGVSTAIFGLGVSFAGGTAQAIVETVELGGTGASYSFSVVGANGWNCDIGVVAPALGLTQFGVRGFRGPIAAINISRRDSSGGAYGVLFVRSA